METERSVRTKAEIIQYVAVLLFLVGSILGSANPFSPIRCVGSVVLGAGWIFLTLRHLSFIGRARWWLLLPFSVMMLFVTATAFDSRFWTRTLSIVVLLAHMPVFLGPAIQSDGRPPESESSVTGPSAKGAK